MIIDGNVKYLKGRRRANEMVVTFFFITYLLCYVSYIFSSIFKIFHLLSISNDLKPYHNLNICK